MSYGDDHIAFAAEYALGTLDAGERAQVETMMAVNKDYAAEVQAWEFRLAALNQMVGSVEPRPIVWENIRAAIDRARPRATLAPPPPVEAEVAQPAPAAQQVPAAQQAPIIADATGAHLASKARRWRSLAAILGAVAAALAAMVALEVLLPDALPDDLRPKVRIRTVEVKVPAAPPAPSSQYAALLQGRDGTAAFILTVDGATRSYTLRKIDADAEPGKSFELWLMSDKLPRASSLGVIGEANFTTRAVLASYDRDIITAATYAVTVEEAGGSRDGSPHSPPVFTGKLIETVPAGAAGQKQK